MRPCPCCAFGLDNNAAVCPRCGTAATTGGPRATPGPPVKTPSPARQAFDALHELADEPLLWPAWVVANLPFLALLSVPLVIGGAVGYLVWDGVGALAGVILTAVLIVAAKAWQEERQGRGRS